MNQRGILRTIKNALERNKIGELLVAKGLISPHDLRHALQEQKATKTPLGQVFVKNAVISQRQLQFLLWKQSALRTCAAAAMLFISMVASERKARADIIDVPSQITLVSASAHFAKVNHYPALYGTQEKRSRDLKAFTKWTKMFDKFERQLKNDSSAQIVRDWQENLRDMQGMSIKAMADRVNTLVNKKRYILDSNNWGQSDYWATPVEFLQRGGDCEDFAIMKYTALRTLGVPEERLRIAIVQDLKKNIPHAVLVVYTEQGAYILDNQNQRLVDAENGSRYRPIYSINRQAWWLHQAPSKTILASAD
ncbi:MAG: transglutaminase-like cysteine peptidase [Alphaproteobacteria bacterium]|nr:transglutaminase-like cysteine peptidase [Alphaproteobacteria bacterium]